MTSAPTPRTRRPIDARQHVWWHRLRRLGRWGFTAAVGVVAAPLATVALLAGVFATWGSSWAGFPASAGLIWLATAPVFAGASLWTYVHMEGRYRATLSVRCPGCGYSRVGASGAGRCPECGGAVVDGAA